MLNFDLSPAYPEIFLLIATSVIMIVDLFVKSEERRLTYYLSLATLAVCAVMSFSLLGDARKLVGFKGLFVSDPLSNSLKFFSYIATAITLTYARQYGIERAIISNGRGGELYTLSLFALLGQMIMISGNNFLSIYLGLELLSLSLYALVALRRDSFQSTEAAMKYFILGALASGFLLYGMSMLYGATGTLDVPEVLNVIRSGTINKTVLVFGTVFIVAGLAFKLGAAPFHMWVPDVYHGAPTPVTLLIGAAPKLAGFAIAFRLLVEALLPLALDWQQMLIIMAILSMAVGNLAAIAQTNLKRMLAYSTISHMGFLILGLATGVVSGSTASSVDAYSASMFYAVTYVLTTLASFGLIVLLAQSAKNSGFEADKLSDLKGLNRRSPWFAFMMLLVMFSLAGVPPMIGFYSKLMILQSVMNAGMVWLAILAVFFSLIGTFYYLRVVKMMYFDEPEGQVAIEAKADMRLVLSLNGIALLGFGLMPSSLMTFCSQVIAKTLGV